MTVRFPPRTAARAAQGLAVALSCALLGSVLHPATAAEMDAPEVSGRSDGGTFAVLADAP